MQQWGWPISLSVAKTLRSKNNRYSRNRRKAILAKQNGCDEVILYKNENFVEKVKHLTNDVGVDVVYDE